MISFLAPQVMRFLALSLWVFFCSANIILVSASNDEETGVRAKMINKKSVVLTIQSLDGDLIDCFDKERQPGLDHPLLKNHKIQKVPKSLLQIKKIGSKKALQIWQRNGTRCPKGTVPVRRTTTAHDPITREILMSKFKRKQQSFYRKPHSDGSQQEHVIVLYEDPTRVNGAGVYGAGASINLWQPSVDMESTDYSATRLRISAGTPRDFDAIEVGWHVYPQLYVNQIDDKIRTRFFISWTNNSYQKPCYNLQCGGFVMEENGLSLGSPIDLISSYDEKQYDMSARILKVPDSKGWWLVVDDAVVGYWPEELFTHLHSKGNSVDWGGEVLNGRRTNTGHRFTEMGSGHSARQGYKKASYFKKLQVYNMDNNPMSVSQDDLTKFESNPQSYNALLVDQIGDSGESGFFYGGPGHGAT